MTRKPIGGLIRKTREAKGVSLGELSRRTKINAAALSRIERGIFEPKYSTLVAICEALTVEVTIAPKGTTLKGVAAATVVRASK